MADPKPPRGCTGYRGPDGALLHDDDTCPLHEAAHLDFITVVDVAEREDHIYVFAKRHDAGRFADAVDGNRDDHDNRAFVTEQPVNVGDAAERLIAAERGDALEELGWVVPAGVVREGGSLHEARRELLSLGADADALQLIRHWLDVDDGAEPVGGDLRSVLPDDVLALIAATIGRDADTIEAPSSTWELLRALFPPSLAPPIDEDGITRIGGGRG